MRRREFIAGLGSGVAWPMVARAQQPERVRRVGVLMAYYESDPEAHAYLSGFTQGLAELGWGDGRNLRMDVRWGAGDVEQMRMSAKELLDLQPDVILAQGTPATAAFQGETRTIPIVFASVSDPVGEGFVASLSRPGGNATGFISQEATVAGKWLELLTEIAADVKRVPAVFNPDAAPGGGQYVLPAFEAAARSYKVAPIVAPIHSVETHLFHSALSDCTAQGFGTVAT
jgi:putative ABC transport system substrate-binding protein